jgi:hypothetical protein
VKRTLFFSLPLLLACSSSEPASPIVAGASASDGGVSFLDGAAAGDGANPTNDASASDSGDASSACTMRGEDGGMPLTPPGALVAAMGTAAPGDVVSLAGMDESTAPTLAVSVCPAADAPTLLFSNSPETPTADGILYADTVDAGRLRLYVYQVNGNNPARRFPVVVFNPGTAGATVKIVRRGLATPSAQYLAVGKSVLADWLTPKTITDVVVAAGERAVIDTAAAQKDELVHAIFDIETTAQLKFSFVSITANKDTLAELPNLALLPAETAHDRGTFANADIRLQAETGAQKSGVQRLRLGRLELYVADKLHFKPAAYVEFAGIITPVLARLWVEVNQPAAGR